MKLLGMMAFGFGLAVSAMPAIAAPPNLYTTLQDAPTDLPTCKSRAQAALAAAGIGNISAGTYSTFGFSGDYSVVVRCVAEKALVVIISAGPTPQECDRLANAVRDRY